MLLLCQFYEHFPDFFDYANLATCILRNYAVLRRQAEKRPHYSLRVTFWSLQPITWFYSFQPFEVFCTIFKQADLMFAVRSYANNNGFGIQFAFEGQLYIYPFLRKLDSKHQCLNTSV